MGTEGWKELRDRHGGLVKPEIVFFGENLPARFFRRCELDMPRCELLLVVGTSLRVYEEEALYSAYRVRRERIAPICLPHIYIYMYRIILY